LRLVRKKLSFLYYIIYIYIYIIYVYYIYIYIYIVDRDKEDASRDENVVDLSIQDSNTIV